MTTKSVTFNGEHKQERDVNKLILILTAAAWFVLGIGVLLSVLNINHLSDQNQMLMVGIGCMVGSVHIYVIRTAIHLVHRRAEAMNEE